MKIGVIGAGSWGIAISSVLSETVETVCLYGRNCSKIHHMKTTRTNDQHLPGLQIPEKIAMTCDFEEAVTGSDLIVLAVASQSVREILQKLKPLIKPSQILVNLSKGIEISSLRTISQIAKDLLPDQPFCVLSGPSHAEEVARKLPTTLVAASHQEGLAQQIQEIFSRDYLRVYTNPDVIGVEVGGALKNIIALGAGISDGLGFGDNTKAALMTRGIKEIATLGVAMGAHHETFRGLSGIGDLIVTCTSMHSRNRRCGILLGQGYTLEEATEEIGMVVEGVFTVKSAYELSKRLQVEAPITEELYRVLYEKADPNDSVMRLMKRHSKDEIEEIFFW
ncbi:MAG: glycerol-3-phosphate dehydrogenase [delta proteobacterium ML8_F1]|nr:MAG: glycerol-3-phosphate dehydrogenase [delta proteobacterium ML8_F1]